MDVNERTKRVLLRCKLKSDLIDTEDLINLKQEDPLAEDDGKELITIVIEEDETLSPGTKRTHKAAGLNNSSKKNIRSKRCTRSTVKRTKYKDFIAESNTDSDNDMHSKIDKLLDDISSDSESDSPRIKGKKSAPRKTFSDCSDEDETYNPSKDETLQHDKANRYKVFFQERLTHKKKNRNRNKRKLKNVCNETTSAVKIEIEEHGADGCLTGLDKDCTEDEEVRTERYRKSRKLVFTEDTASSVESGGEGEELDIVKVRETSKKIWHKNYGYIISRTLPNGHTYLRCYRGNCKGTAFCKNGRIYTGNLKHDHSRKQDVIVRECDEYRVELYKLTAAKVSASTREIYDLVGAKFPNAAKKMPFPQMSNLIRRWKRKLDSQDNINSLSDLANIIEGSYDENSTELFFSGKVESSNGYVAVILGFKDMILDAYTPSKLLYIDINTRIKCTVSYIEQMLTLFCVLKGKILPMCYVLMENNFQELYESVFQHIKSILAASVNPSFIICDYELNLRNSLKRIYDKATLHGHFFHFAQRVYQQASKLRLIAISEGEIANNVQHDESVSDCDRIIMRYYSLPLLPEEAMQEGLDHLIEIQPKSFKELSDYIKDEWINNVGIKHFTIYKQTYRANDVLDVYYRKLNDILKNCCGSIKIYDNLERHHEFIKKQCSTLLHGERANQGLSKQERLFHPFLKQAWDDFDAGSSTVSQFMEYCCEFMRELQHIFKYWHVDDVVETELANTRNTPFVPQDNNKTSAPIVVIEAPKPQIEPSPPSARPYAKISPNREIRYRNANVFRHDGYAYNRQNVRRKDGVVVKYMACRVTNCNGTLILKNDVVTPGKNGHNHPREEIHNSERVMIFKQQLRALVKEHRTMASIDIYKIAAERHPDGAKVYSSRLAIQAMGRWKRLYRSAVTASQPTTISGLEKFLHSDEGKQLFSVDSYGVNYYSGTVQTTTGQYAVIFGDTQWIVDNFKASQNWIVDSNYRGASNEPKINHVMVVFSLSREHVLPIAYILMEDRSEDLYTAVFSHMKKNLAPGIYPSFIMCDYDEMIHNAIKDVYNEATLQGSLFHYAQTIYRKAYTFNLISTTPDPLTHRTLLQYYALALLPSDRIESGLDSLLHHQPKLEGFAELNRYVREQWVERVGTAHMSTFMQCYRTSNALELFQRVFNDKLNAAGPPIFELLELIQKIHNTSKSDCEHLRKGKRQYLDRIGQRFDRLIDFKVNPLWKKLSSRKISVEGFLDTAADYLESLHYVYNTWDLHDDKLDIKAPLMIEDNFVLQTDDTVRATVLFVESDDVQNCVFETTKTEHLDEKQDFDNMMDMSKISVMNMPEIGLGDRVNIQKKMKPRGRIMSRRGINGFWQDGYCYYGNKMCPKTEDGPERRYMQCRVKGCRGTAIIINGEFQLGKMEHNHKRDFNKEQMEEFNKTVKEMVFSQPLSNREIYDLAATMNPAAALLVSFQSLECRFRRWRRTRYIPIIPSTLSDMDRILTDAQGVNLVHTRNGSLYSGTVTGGGGKCAVVLGEDHFVRQLMSCKDMYIERSWRIAARDVKVECVVTVMFVTGFQVVPIAYILMEDDSEELYHAAFKYFKETLVPSFKPAFIMCDYDVKLHNVLERIYGEANIQGCFFHYAQAIYRKAYSLGIVEPSAHHESCKVLKQYYALALLPAESMACGLQYLNQIQPKGLAFMDLWNYVKSIWFDQVGSEHFSVYEQPLRCNDTQEHFHKRHNGILEEAHPGIIHLIVHLKKTHDVTISEYGTRLKQRPAQTIRKSKQLFHTNLTLIWKRHIASNTSNAPAVFDKFFTACEEIVGDLHYVFTTWGQEEMVGEIPVPYLRHSAFVKNPDCTLHTNRLFKKNGKALNDATDAEQSEDEFEEQNASNSKTEKLSVIRYSEILWRDGYGFHIVKKCRENAAGQLVTYIRCKVPNCRARGSIINERWNLTTELHNHSKDIYAEEDAAFRLALKQLVGDQPLPLDEIYNLVASLYPESAERTPMKKIRPIMIRWKKKFVSRISTSMTGSLIDVDRLLVGDSGMQLVQTAKGSVYSGQVTTASGECALVFAEHQFIQEAFMASTNLFIDSNYRCAPRDPFVDHLLIFFSVCRDHVLPFAYVLMGSNTEDLYVAVLEYIKNTLATNINPEYIICDYDITLHNSVRQVYSTAHIHGSFFHYAQAIYRTAHLHNITDSVVPDSEHYSTLMQYYSLSLLPKDDIESALDQLSDIQPPEFKKLWMYVREQWLDRVGLEHLSMFGQAYRANPSFELLSRKLNDMSKEAHPKMNDLIANLVKVHQQVRADYEQLRRGRHSQRLGRAMDRLFYADVRRAWRRLGDARISSTDFMRMSVEYMTNTHFVFSTWDVSSERDAVQELPYMLDTPFVAHWCVDSVRSEQKQRPKRRDRKAGSIEERDYASGADEQFDNNGDDSTDELIDPLANYGSDQTQPQEIVEQIQVVIPAPIAVVPIVERKLCLLCDAQNRTHACIPCGHLCYCMNCFPAVSRRVEMDKKCPVCQTPYMLVLEIHF